MKTQTKLEFMFDLSDDDGDHTDIDVDKGYPQELAQDMLYFWKQFHFPSFNPKNAYFGHHDKTSLQVSLYVNVRSNFKIPSQKQLDSFCEKVGSAAPDTYQESITGLLYGKFLDIAGVSLIHTKSVT